MGNLVGSIDPANTKATYTHTAATSSPHWLRTTGEDNFVVYHFSNLEFLSLARLCIALADYSHRVWQLFHLSGKPLVLSDIEMDSFPPGYVRRICGVVREDETTDGGC